MTQPNDKKTLRVGLAGLGAVGLEVAKRLIAGVPGLTLAAVAVRDAKRRNGRCRRLVMTFPSARLPNSQTTVTLSSNVSRPLCSARSPSAPSTRAAFSCRFRSRNCWKTTTSSTAQRQKNARILVPTGALIGLDAVRAAAESTIHSVKMVTRKPPAGLDGAPYLRERGISVTGLKEPLKVFDGSAREGARGFPTNVNVAAALSLAGIGPDRTQLEIWADPSVTRNTHTITVDADTARFTMTIENIPSENPRTGKSVAPSTVAALRALVSELKVGT